MAPLPAPRPLLPLHASGYCGFASLHSSDHTYTVIRTKAYARTMADGCIAANKVVVEEIWEEFVKDIVEVLPWRFCRGCCGGGTYDTEEVHTTAGLLIS